MSRILLIESATALCSVALSENGRILSIKESASPNTHGEVMTRLVEACMAEAGKSLQEIDAVAVSGGPGSYTALRVGAATAKAICYVLGKPLIKVDTLKALAWGMREKADDPDALFCPMIDARRMEVYTAIYGTDLELLSSIRALIIEEGSFAEWIKDQRLLVFAGDGSSKCKPILSKPGTRFIDVPLNALLMRALAEAAYEERRFENVAYFSPTYIKAPNITTSKKKWWG